MALCRGCGEVKPLIAAHIIPKAFYPKPSPVGPALLIPSNPEAHVARSRIGIYDEGILCRDCDAELGRFDQHAAETLLHGPYIEPLPGMRTYTKADANCILRFAFSMLWRASISSHSTYRHVALGPYEDCTKAFVFGGQLPRGLGLVIAEFDVSQVPWLNPVPIRMDGVRIFTFYAARFIFELKVDKKPMPNAYRPFVVSEDGAVHSVIRPWDDSKEAALIRKMYAQNIHVAKATERWHKSE